MTSNFGRIAPITPLTVDLAILGHFGHFWSFLGDPLFDPVLSHKNEDIFKKYR